jgi:hypothetical protein
VRCTAFEYQGFAWSARRAGHSVTESRLGWYPAQKWMIGAQENGISIAEVMAFSLSKIFSCTKL